MFAPTKLNRIAIAVAVSIGLSAPAFAQETSSGISGKIVTPAGTPAAGTAVKIIHLPSGTVRNAVVNNSGSFNLKGLRVGGPYQIIVDSQTFQDTTVDGVFLELGETFDVNVALQSDQNIEVINVTASQVSTSIFGSNSPGTVFNLADLENSPAINRDIKDVIRTDPRVYIDESRSDSVQCAGASPRFNSLTLDGVRLNDNFGLNSNGYPTERMPFSFDAIEQVAVELAPFDVQYGGFTACNINAVTKSGTNEIHGGVFFDYTSDSFRGEEVKGDKQENGDYTEKRYGFNVGLPLIKDELFVFAAYEKVEGVQLFGYAARDNGRVTSAEIAEITQIAADVYNYDVGGFPASAPVEDEKLLVKLDWNISDQHRASFVYNWNDGFSISQSDGGSSALSFGNHFYERGAELDSLVASVYSDWSDKFSTEVRLGQTKLDNRQSSLDQSGFAEAQIRSGSGATVYIGPDDSRQSNDLNWENITAKFAGTYYTDNDHKITFGLEYEDLDVFNLFMQHTVGEYRFDNIADFAAGTPARIYYNNSAGTNNPADAGASFSYATTTLYVQDDFYVTDDIQLMVGLRYDMWSSDDRPTLNANFTERYGFANTANVDGIKLLQPRVGFNWAVQDNLEVRGGFGLYAGGNPNVWISNAYSNDGVTNIGLQDRSRNSVTTAADGYLTGAGRPIYDIPQALFDEVAATSIADGNGNVNATDPSFDIPSEWKYSLGATYITADDYVITADIMYTDKQNSATVVDLGLTPSGFTAVDGRPLYETSTTGRRAGSDFMLTNVNSANDGDSTTISASIQKDWENGFNGMLAYAYTEATDANPMTSSVAYSNFINVAVADVNAPQAATSDYEIPHRFTMKFGYTTELFDGYKTSFNLYATASDGKPYSATFSESGGDLFGFDSSSTRGLVYIPEVNDAGVVYGSGFDQAAFDDFIEAEGLTRGSILGRNSFNAEWWSKVDIRISQELPGFVEGHKASAFFVIENLTNMLNDDWGVLRQGSFVGEQIVNANINDAGQYVYESFNAPETSYVRGPSLWEVRVGVKYSF
jgi:hypothetical protein